MRTPMPGAAPARTVTGTGTGTSAVTGTGTDELEAAIEHGRTCALAAEAHKDLQECGREYPALFPGNPFDPRLYGTVALANAFGSPWETPERIRAASRSSLWVFAADWAVDYLARSPADLADLVRRCIAAGATAVAKGGEPVHGATPPAGAAAGTGAAARTDSAAGTGAAARTSGADRPGRGDQAEVGATPGESVTVHAELARFLTAIRAELATGPLFPALDDLWQEQLACYLTAMAREWDWKTAAGRNRRRPGTGGTGPQTAGPASAGGQAGDQAREQAGALPTFAEYLANADNFGSALVNLSHWIITGDHNTLRHIDLLHDLSRQVQRILRLLNDLTSHQRDLEWGDLNGLMLGVGREEVGEHIAGLVSQCRTALAPLAEELPRETAYLERQIGYSTGFYGLTDYWGSL